MISQLLIEKLSNFKYFENRDSKKVIVIKKLSDK